MKKAALRPFFLEQLKFQATTTPIRASADELLRRLKLGLSFPSLHFIKHQPELLRKFVIDE